MTAIDAGREARLEEFRAAVLAKLNEPRCVAKSDWRELPLEHLLELLRCEVVEISGAIERLRIVRRYHPSVTSTRGAELQALAITAIAAEATDVGAFSYFIFDVCRTLRTAAKTDPCFPHEVLRS